jgi:hypothetical protein
MKFIIQSRAIFERMYFAKFKPGRELRRKYSEIPVFESKLVLIKALQITGVLLQLRLQIW